MRLVHALARRAGLRFFRFFSRRLGSGEADPQLRLVGESEALGLCADAELDLGRDRVAAAFARGDLCVGAFPDGRLAGYCWLAFAPLPHLDGVWVGFASHVAWTYKSYVRAAHRGRRIAGRLYRFADRLCLERGRSLSLICVEPHNRASVDAALQAGYAASGAGGYLRRQRVHSWLSPEARAAGVHFYVPDGKGT